MEDLIAKYKIKLKELREELKHCPLNITKESVLAAKIKNCKEFISELESLNPPTIETPEEITLE